MNQQIEVSAFHKAVDAGEVLERDGYHQPRQSRCGCDLTTDKGAYRDVSVEFPDGAVIHYYHQTPVVSRFGDRYRLDSGGWQTRSTKQRINRHLPSGYSVVGRCDTRRSEADWRVSLPDGEEVDFSDGMMVG